MREYQMRNKSQSLSVSYRNEEKKVRMTLNHDLLRIAFYFKSRKNEEKSYKYVLHAAGGLEP